MKLSTYKGLSDQDLATIALDDRQAAEELLLRVRPRIRRAIRMIAGNDRDYDDLFSQVCLQILESIGNYKGTGTLEAWAGRITFHVVLKHKQRRRMIENIMVPDFQNRGIENSNPEQEVSRKHARDLMRDALRKIPEDRRNTLVLRLGLGHSISEIAQITKTPVNTVRGRLRTGLKELRQGIITKRDCILAK